MNPITRFAMTALLMMSTLAGCALPGAIAINATNADELQRRLGKPTETLANPAGGEFWDYAYGPEGMETWRFGVDGGRVVRSKEQLLTFERLHMVNTGSATQAQVRGLLGKPSQILQFAMGPVWEWRVNMHPTPGHFFVQFDQQGVATGKGAMTDFHADGDDKGNP